MRGEVGSGARVGGGGGAEVWWRSPWKGGGTPNLGFVSSSSSIGVLEVVVEGRTGIGHIRCCSLPARKRWCRCVGILACVCQRRRSFELGTNR